MVMGVLLACMNRPLIQVAFMNRAIVQGEDFPPYFRSQESYGTTSLNVYKRERNQAATRVWNSEAEVVR